MTVVDVPDRGVWASTSAPAVAFDEGGQLSWQLDFTDELADSERRSSPFGDRIVLRQVWSRDRRVLRRLVVECDWQHGPLVLVEARRPRGGWRGDELRRLMLAVLSFGTAGS